MRLAVVTEFSTKTKNPDIARVLDELGFEYINVGMKNVDDEPQLNYVETAFIAAIAYHLNACDYIIAGCGTGEGFCIALNQFPAMMCGHIESPLDAWLFQQINGGNAASFMFNKDYGWGADINFKFMMERLFDQPIASGYPKSRADVQQKFRQLLVDLSVAGKKTMVEVVDVYNQDSLKNILKFPGFIDWVKASKGGDEALRAKLVEKYKAL